MQSVTSGTADPNPCPRNGSHWAQSTLISLALDWFNSVHVKEMVEGDRKVGTCGVNSLLFEENFQKEIIFFFPLEEVISVNSAINFSTRTNLQNKGLFYTLSTVRGSNVGQFQAWLIPGAKVPFISLICVLIAFLMITRWLWQPYKSPPTELCSEAQRRASSLQRVIPLSGLNVPGRAEIDFVLLC